MSRPPMRAKRDANEPEIFATLRAHGLTVHAMDRPVDALVGFRGRSYLVEVKTPTGKPTEAQARFLKTWRGDYTVLRTVEQAEAFAKKLRSGADNY